MAGVQLVFLVAGAVVHLHVDQLVIILVSATIVQIAFGSPAASLLVLLLHPFVFGAAVLEPHLHLRLGQIEGLGQGLALGPHHVLVALEGVLQLQELRRREGGTNAFRLAERRYQETLKKKKKGFWLVIGLGYEKFISREFF